MKPLEETLRLIQRETGFSTSLHSHREFNLAMAGNEEKLRASYVKRLKAFVPYMGTEKDRLRAVSTIDNLVGQAIENLKKTWS